MSEADTPRFYGRRSGKRLRSQAQARMVDMLPRLTIPVPEQGRAVDIATLFTRPVQEVWLEIGFGGGEHLAAQSRLYPQIGHMGSEVFVNGIASLMKHLETDQLDHIRVFAEDVRLLFPALPDGCLSRVFLLFPDPWPKTRHAGRRFVGPDNLNALARLMKAGGELRVASDDPIYVKWALAHLHEHPAFTALQVTQNRAELPADWPVTRYEAKLLAGHPPTFMRFMRALPAPIGD